MAAATWSDIAPTSSTGQVQHHLERSVAAYGVDRGAGFPHGVERGDRAEQQAVAQLGGQAHRLRAVPADEQRWRALRRPLQRHAVEPDVPPGGADPLPASRARTAAVYSRSNVIGDATAAPACAIQSSTPWPSPGRKRSGKSRVTVAISMAVSAGLRRGTGSNPMPTCSRDVQASAAAADAIPPSKNESSHSHSCATPAASADSATERNRSGGNCGRNTTPNTWLSVL